MNDDEINIENEALTCNCGNIIINGESISDIDSRFFNEFKLSNTNDNNPLYLCEHKGILISGFDQVLVNQCNSTKFHLLCPKCQISFLLLYFTNNLYALQNINIISNDKKYTPEKTKLKKLSTFFPQILRPYFSLSKSDQSSPVVLPHTSSELPPMIRLEYDVDTTDIDFMFSNRLDPVVGSFTQRYITGSVPYFHDNDENETFF